MKRFTTHLKEMAMVNAADLDKIFLKRAQKVTSFNLSSADFTTTKYKAEIQFLFATHFFEDKFDLDKTIKGFPKKDELNKLIRKLKQINLSKFNALHNYNLKGVGPGEATLFFLLDDASLGGGSASAADININGQAYEVKAGNYNAKQKAYKDFKLGGTVPLDALVREAFKLRNIVDPDLKMSKSGAAEKNGVNGQQIEAIMKDKGLAAQWEKNVEVPYRKLAAKYLNKNPLILMINTTPKPLIGEVYHIGSVRENQIKVDVVTQGTIKPKLEI